MSLVAKGSDQITLPSLGPTGLGQRAKTKTEILGSETLVRTKTLGTFLLLIVVPKSWSGAFVQIHVAIILYICFWVLNSHLAEIYLNKPT